MNTTTWAAAPVGSTVDLAAGRFMLGTGVIASTSRQYTKHERIVYVLRFGRWDEDGDMHAFWMQATAELEFVDEVDDATPTELALVMADVAEQLTGRWTMVHPAAQAAMRRALLDLLTYDPEDEGIAQRKLGGVMDQVTLTGVIG